MYWFIADTHFNHTNIIKFLNRPFENIKDMDDHIITYWNLNIGEDDTIFHLGDFSFGDPSKYLKRLNGNIILINGNHDYKYFNSRYNNLIKSRHDLLSICIEDQDIILCHYALRVWHKSHFNSWHLYGHSHGRLPSEGKSMDVGVDCNNFLPISFDQIKIIMQNKPNNSNYIERKK